MNKQVLESNSVLFYTKKSQHYGDVGAQAQQGSLAMYGWKGMVKQKWFQLAGCLKVLAEWTERSGNGSLLRARARGPDAAKERLNLLVTDRRSTFSCWSAEQSRN